MATTRRSATRRSRTHLVEAHHLAVGEYYPVDGAARIIRSFRTILESRGLPPQVFVSDAFTTKQPSAMIIRSIVNVEGNRFLIYGYTNPDPSSAVNDLLRSLKPSTVWRGEIVVFVLGKRVPLLSRPHGVQRRKHNLAIRLYV